MGAACEQGVWRAKEVYVPCIINSLSVDVVIEITRLDLGKHWRSPDFFFPCILPTFSSMYCFSPIPILLTNHNSTGAFRLLGDLLILNLDLYNPSQSTTQRNIFDPGMEILCSSQCKNLSVTISGSFFFFFANMYRFDQVFSVLFSRKHLIPKSNNQNRKECIIFCLVLK